jgi:ATP/maltotriose-dependent transcriptional regulator MalT
MFPPRVCRGGNQRNLLDFNVDQEKAPFVTIPMNKSSEQTQKFNHSAISALTETMKTTPEELSEELHGNIIDALLRHRITPTREMLEDIAAAFDLSSPSEEAFAILCGALRGSEDKEIAAELGIHLNTVAYHWREIRRRLGITGRVQIGATIVASLCKHTVAGSTTRRVACKVQEGQTNRPQRKRTPL